MLEQKKHICLFPGRLNLGGVGKNTLNLAEALVQRGHKVDLFLTTLAGEYKSLIPGDVNVYYGKGSAIKSFWALRAYLRRESPDMLITARDYLNVVGFIASKLSFSRALHVATLRTSLTADRQVRSGFKYFVVQLLAKYSYKHMDSVVAVSQAVADDYRSVFEIPDLRVIYNPIITDRFDALQGADIEHKFAPNFPIILAVGRLSPEKGFDTLIRAFSEVHSKREGAQLCILGEGPMRAELELLVERLELGDSVVMPGYIVNPISYMARSSVFVVPSLWEGLPTAMVEALAAGVSVVATRCPGGSTEILAGGEFGTLVNMSSPGELANAISLMLVNPLVNEKTIARGRSFSANSAVNQYLSLLNS